MKTRILTSLFALCAMASQAQETQNSNSVPLDSVIIEGVVTNISDSTHFDFLQYEDSGLKKLQDFTIKNGKFRVAVLPKNKEETYWLRHYGTPLIIYVEPGLKIKVTGDGALTLHNWYVESENFEQKEINAYNQFAKEHVPDYYETDDKWNVANSALTEKLITKGSLTQEDQENAIPEVRALRQKVEALRKEKYNAAIIDFMKDRPFSKQMISELYSILSSDDNPTLKEKACEIFKKYPQEAMNEEYVAETKALLNANKAKVGEQMKDFTLFDREGKKHQLSEFKGKYTILEFTSADCGWSNLIKPILDEFYKRNKDKMELVSISQDSEKIWMGEDSKVSFHEWNDHARSAEPAVTYGVIGNPSFVIVDPDGKILGISAGADFSEVFKYISDAEIEKKLKETIDKAFNS